MNGQRIAFWHEDWGVGILQYQFPTLYTFAISGFITLAKVLEGADIRNKFRDDLSQQETDELHQLNCLLVLNPVRQEIGSDGAIWKWEESGQFTVRLAYYALKNTPRIRTGRHKLSKLVVPPRMQVFAW